MLRGQPGRPRSGSKGRSSSRRLNFGLKRLAFECLSASLSIELLWVIVGKPCRRSVARYLARQLETFASDLKLQVKLLHEPLSAAAVRELGAYYHPEP